MDESVIDHDVAFVAYDEAAEVSKPRDRSFDDFPLHFREQRFVSCHRELLSQSMAQSRPQPHAGRKFTNKSVLKQVQVFWKVGQGR